MVLISFSPCNSQSDSLINELKILDDTSSVLNLLDVGVAFHKESKYESSLDYFLKADSLAQRINYTIGKIKSWRNIGSLHALLGNTTESLDFLNKGLALIENLANALIPYIEATQICREHGFDAKRSMLLNNTGIFYRKLKRYKESIAIYQESYELRSKMKDTMGMANNLYNATAAYSKMGEHENALKSVRDARRLYSLINSENDLILSILSEANSLNELGRQEEALAVANKLNKFKKLPFDLEQQINYHLMMAQLHLLKNDVDLGLDFLNKIEDRIVTSEFNYYKSKFFKLKSEALTINEDYKLSNIYLNKYVNEINDRNKRDEENLLKEMETKYLSNEKDHKIALLDSENSLHEAKLSASSQRNIFLLSGLISFGLLSILMFYLYNKIKSKNQIINVSNQEKETLLKEIHHRVKNNLQVISALLSLQSKYINDDNALVAIKEGRDRVESMALIHKDLYQHDNLKGVNTQFYLEQLIENLFNSYKIQ